jgi:hypothetical protein
LSPETPNKKAAGGVCLQLKKMIYLLQYRQSGIKIIPKIKIKAVCLADGHKILPC